MTVPIKAAPVLAGAALLAGCVAAFPLPLPQSQRAQSERMGPAPPEAARTIGASPFAGPWDMIEFETNSWGFPLTSWRLGEDGTGSFTRAERPGGAPLDRYTLVTRQLSADAAAYARLRGLIEALPYPAPGDAACGMRITDQAYGRLRLVRGASTLELAFDTGCRGEGYAAYLEGLRTADALVSGIGEAGAVERREEVGGAGGSAP